MDDRIVRIPLEGDAREGPPHPEVERIVQEEIGQQRTDDAPNTKGNVAFDRTLRYR
jgi:hypothetical protein